MQIEEKLPDIFKSRAYHPNAFTYAFRRTDLDKLFEELMQSNIAIVGGEVWLIEGGNTLSIIPKRSGEMQVFNFKVEKKGGEEWYDFVERSVKFSRDLITNWNLEKTVRLDKVNRIVYHLKLEEEKV